jgi:hypothetical protein
MPDTLNSGVWFRSAYSGLWYRNHKCAGTGEGIDAIMVEGELFPRVPLAEMRHDHFSGGHSYVCVFCRKETQGPVVNGLDHDESCPMSKAAQDPSNLREEE